VDRKPGNGYLEYAFHLAGFSRAHPDSLALKKYTDEQAKSEVFRLARSIDSKKNLRNGHSDRLVACAQKWEKSLGLGKEDLQELRIACWLHYVGKIKRARRDSLKPGLWTRRKKIMQEASGDWEECARRSSRFAASSGDTASP